jgi:hypothetical protein
MVGTADLDCPDAFIQVPVLVFFWTTDEPPRVPVAGGRAATHTAGIRVNITSQPHSPDPKQEDPLVADKLSCDLEHERAVQATLKLEIKSIRVGRPGRPMVRAVAVCAAHARELRKLGLEVIDA